MSPSCQRLSASWAVWDAWLQAVGRLPNLTSGYLQSNIAMGNPPWAFGTIINGIFHCHVWLREGTNSCVCYLFLLRPQDFTGLLAISSSSIWSPSMDRVAWKNPQKGRPNVTGPSSSGFSCSSNVFLRSVVQFLCIKLCSICVYSGLLCCHFEKEHWSRMFQTIKP